MVRIEEEKSIAQLIVFGIPAVSLFIWSSGVTDPVNATKLLVAGGVGSGLLGIFLFFDLKQSFTNFKKYILTISFFSIAMIVSVIYSDSPLTQNIYGSYGRNTGFITYLFLCFIALGVLKISKAQNFRKIILALQFTGFINMIYCGWVLLFGDFIGWSNPYGDILGFFGNPNFISSFLGMFIGTLFVYMFGEEFSAKIKLIAGLCIGLSFFEILKSHSIQGIVVSAIGFGLVLYFWVRAKTESRLVDVIYLSFGFLISLIALLGSLKKGPLDFIYKTSVSLRGAYWDAGIKMGMEHPLTGVGMDSYGDWYRRTRSESAATVLPGPKTISNTAHNVFIDLFSNGGWPLLIPYLGIVLIVAISSLRIFLRSRKMDPIFIALLTGWLGYQMQSIISINQIGLAVWGWLLGGAIVAYEFHTRAEFKIESKISGKNHFAAKRASVISPGLVGGIFVTLGLLIASPPLTADSKWKSALDSRDARRIIVALQPGYLNPSDSNRYAQAVGLLAASNLNDLAHQVAIEAVQYNKDSTDAWANLYSLPNATVEEKATAFSNLKRLDPFNPDVTAR